MTATIIQFPQTHSNAFLNITRLVELATDNRVVEQYAELMAVCHEEGKFRSRELETLQEQIRAKRLENARPEKKTAVIPTEPGLYCYTPEMGEQKPECQIEANMGYYGDHYYLDTPLELRGRGVVKTGEIINKDPNNRGHYKNGWFQYRVTERAFQKLKTEYTISEELNLD